LSYLPHLFALHPLTPQELGRKRSGKYGGSGLRPLREHKEGVNKESKRAKELRERRAYLKNFWYAAGQSVRGYIWKSKM
jgi:hypothetical protein